MRENNTQIHIHNFIIKCHLVNMFGHSKCQHQVPLLKHLEEHTFVQTSGRE